MNLEALQAEARTLIDGAKAGTLTDEQAERLISIRADLEAAKARQTAVAEAEGILSGIKSAGPVERKNDDEAPAASLGAHFVKSVDLGQFKANKALTQTAPEFKAAGDPAAVGSIQVNDVDREVAGLNRRKLTLAALFTQGTVSGNGVTYMAEELTEGSIAAVAEGQPAPKLTYRFVEKRDGLSRVAGLTDITEDMLEDLDYVASEIDGNLSTDLDIEEERQLLTGDGVGPNLHGILSRSGILSVASANVKDNADALHRATTQVSVASGREADAIVIHPVDFERERLAKNADGDYIAGGPFGSYGTPVIWGRPAVVTTAIAQGTALVGAFGSAALKRKGGTTVTTGEQNKDNLERGLVTLRATKRLALQVKRPAAFAKVTLSDVVPA